MTKSLFVLLFFMSLVLSSASLQAKSLCTGKEQVLFSCSIQKSSKVLSVCGVKGDAGGKGGHLVYRFGMPQKVELEFPKVKEGSFGQFTYRTYFRGGGVQNAGLDLFSLHFMNEDATYEVFSNWSAEDNGSSYGVTVTTDKETTLNCRAPVIDEIHYSTSAGGWVHEVIQKD